MGYKDAFWLKTTDENYASLFNVLLLYGTMLSKTAKNINKAENENSSHPPHWF